MSGAPRNDGCFFPWNTMYRRIQWPVLSERADFGAADLIDRVAQVLAM